MIKETQEGMFIMKWRNFIPMMISVIIGTNSFSIIYQNIKQNELEIQYNKERADRIAERKAEESKDYHDLQILKQRLKDCEKEKS
tara:strand:+ start:2550 stop:2804 length:255 start_codon:yes stop_codon:yes gene_type:complete